MSATAVARVSLGRIGPPVTRTNHSIVVRARKASGTGSVIMRVALYEGVTNRSGDLDSAALTTTLADYTINISDASAAAISNYDDLELRFWGFSSTNDLIVVTVADIYLATPVAAWVRTNADSLGITDAQSFVQGIGRSQTIADSLALTDARTTLRQGGVTIADNLALTSTYFPVLTPGIPEPDNPSFDTDLSSWTLQAGSGAITRNTTIFDTSPACLQYTPGANPSDLTSHYIQETFSGIFRAGVEYTLSIRATGGGAQADATFRFGDNVLGDYTDTGSTGIGSGTNFLTKNISWTPAADSSQVTLRIGAVVGSTNYYFDSLILTAGHDPNIVRSLAPEALALTDAITRAATWFRSLSDAIALTDSQTGSTLPGGTTQTPIMRLSLESGGAPTSRTAHSITVRARKVSGTGTVTIRAALYEGATNRSGDLESTALTTSLADKVLAISDANAAAITNYLDLELRVWGVSSTGDTVNIEIADVSLTTPPSGPASYTKTLTEALAVADVPATVIGPIRTITDNIAVTDSASGETAAGPIHSSHMEAGGFAPVFMMMPGTEVHGSGTVSATGHDVPVGGASYNQGVADTLGITDARVPLSHRFQVVSDNVALSDAVLNQNTMIVPIADLLGITDASAFVSAAAILIPDNLHTSDVIDVLYAPGGTIFNQSLTEALALAETVFIPNVQRVWSIGDFIAMQEVLAFRRSLHIPDIFIVSDAWTFHGTAFIAIIDVVYPLTVTVEAVPSLLATIQTATVLLLVPDIQFKLIDADQQYAEASVEDIAVKLVTIEEYVRR